MVKWHCGISSTLCGSVASVADTTAAVHGRQLSVQDATAPATALPLDAAKADAELQIASFTSYFAFLPCLALPWVQSTTSVLKCFNSLVVCLFLSLLLLLLLVAVVAALSPGILACPRSSFYPMRLVRYLSVSCPLSVCYVFLGSRYTLPLLANCPASLFRSAALVPRVPTACFSSCSLCCILSQKYYLSSFMAHVGQ